MADPTQLGTVHTYARVSHADEKSGSCSLSWQHDLMTAWLHTHEFTPGHEFEDNGVSASVPLDQRRAGKQLVGAAVNRGDVIVVARLDRLFRDVQDFRTRLAAWLSQGVQLVSCSEALDFTSATGRLIATILAAVSEYERELIGQRTRRDSIATRKAHGLRVAGEARYGWRFAGTGKYLSDGSEQQAVEPDPREQWVLRRIVALRDQAMSLRGIAEELTRGKHPTSRGGEWSHSTVADILREIEQHLAPFEANYDQIEADTKRGSEYAAKNGGRR